MQITLNVKDRGGESTRYIGGFSSDDTGMAAMLESWTFAHRHVPTAETLVELNQRCPVVNLDESFQQTFG